MVIRALSAGVLIFVVAFFAVELSAQNYAIVSYRTAPDPDWQKAKPVVELMAFVMSLGAALAIERRRAGSRDPLWRVLLPALLLVIPGLWAGRGGSLGFAGLYLWVLVVGWVALRAGAVCLANQSDQPDQTSRVAATGRATPAIIAVLVLLHTICFSYASIQHYASLNLGYSDIGDYAVRLKNTVLHGAFLQTRAGLSPFFDHFNPGLALLVPLYWAVPRIELLTVVQAFSLSAAAIPLFLLARAVLKDDLSAGLIAATWFVYPSISQLNYNFSYGFHPVTMAVPWMLASFYGWERRRLPLFVFAAVLACSMEEHVCVIYLGMGAMLAIPKETRRFGLLLAGCALAYFAIVTGMIMPAVSDSGQYSQLAKFDHLGKGFGTILLSPVLRPDVFWGKLLEPATWYFLGALLVPLALAPLLAPRVAAAAAVALSFVLLWNDPFCKTICFQYQTTVLPVLFYAAVHGLMQLQKASELHAVVGCAMVSTVKSARGWSRAGSIALFTASIAACAFLGLHAFSKFNLPYVFRIETSRLPALERIVGGIPPGASVLASHRAAAHLLNDYEVSIVADEIRSDFVLIDLKDSWGDVAGLEKLRKRVEESRAYAPVDSGDGIFLYQRISPGTSSVLP